MPLFRHDHKDEDPEQGSPDEAVPEPNELEWDLAEAPGALLGPWGEVDPAPIVPMPEVEGHGREGKHS